jgi:hypothetical protein
MTITPSECRSDAHQIIVGNPGDADRMNSVSFEKWAAERGFQVQDGQRGVVVLIRPAG